MKLKVAQLSFSIGEKKIVSDFDLEIKEGEFVGLIGPNGCGKSTLLKNIYRVLTPDHGVVWLDDRKVRDMGSKELAQNMSVMIQENNVEFDMTVMDMVLLGRYAHKKILSGANKRDWEIARQSLHEVGMDDYGERSFLSLSGGEKQRILIARALTQQADLIILDEPTNHLDIQYQYQIMDILKRQQVTVFSSVHDLNIAAYYCDRIVVMKHGRLLCQGTPDEVITEELIDELYHIRADIRINEVTGKKQIYYMP